MNKNFLSEKYADVLDTKLKLDAFFQYENLLQKAETAKTLDELYEITERISQCIKTIYPDIFCRMGCNNCCKIYGSPEIFQVEWERIENYLNNSDESYKINIRNSLTELKNSFRNILKSNQIMHVSKIIDRIKCPFLHEEKCSIYHLRPIVCRMYGIFILSPEPSKKTKNIIYTCEQEMIRWEKKFTIENPSVLLLPQTNIFYKKVEQFNQTRGKTYALLYFANRYFEKINAT